MTDALLLEVLLEVRALRCVMERLAPPPPPKHTELLQALASAFPGSFSSAEVLALADLELSTREPLRQALAGLGIKDAHGLGLALAALVKTTVGQPLRLLRSCKESNSRLWAVEGAEGV